MADFYHFCSDCKYYPSARHEMDPSNKLIIHSCEKAKLWFSQSDYNKAKSMPVFRISCGCFEPAQISIEEMIKIEFL